MTWSGVRLSEIGGQSTWAFRDGKHSIEVRGSDADVMHVLEALRAYESKSADSYCEACDDEHWLPNDESDTPGNPYKPCPYCNPKGAIPCPYVFVADESLHADGGWREAVEA